MIQEASRPCQVAILAGGMGTRLKARTGNLPKPMAPVLGRPVLEHLIGLCRRHGFADIALLVHYEHEAISRHFGDGSDFGVRLHYVVEAEARGTAGALCDALPLLAPTFLVLYGDTYADIDLKAVRAAHERAGASATLLLHPNDHPHDSDLVEINAQGRVLAVHAYPHPETLVCRNLVNAALYVMERDAIAPILPRGGKADLAKHSFPAMLVAGLHLYGHVTPEYIKDMGTPDRLDKVERDLLAGLPERLSTRQLRDAVFLDRDGTLNVEVNHLASVAQFRLIEGAAQAVRRLNREGRLAVVVTNQPVIARGELGWDGLAAIHARMEQDLGQHKAYVDGIYVCPHHPHAGYSGEMADLKIDCDCRKPRTGLIDRAVRELDIDRRRSWMVGDTTSDLMAGRSAGLRTVLVRTGHAGRDGKYPVDADYVCPDLASAVDWILTGHADVSRQLVPVLEPALRARLVLIGGPARTGKSSTARVLQEMLAASDCVAHVISLDGWLRPLALRPEGQGVRARYDLDAVGDLLDAWLGTRTRVSLEVPIYDAVTRSMAGQRAYSLGPDDVVLLEGVPALLDEGLRQRAQVLVQIDATDGIRQQRLELHDLWRGVASNEAAQRRAAREVDEVAPVRAAAMYATFRIVSEVL